MWQLAITTRWGSDGNGLGLPLTKRLVELHGGSLAIESEPGRGTLVVIALPAWRAEAAKYREVAPAPRGVP